MKPLRLSLHSPRKKFVLMAAVIAAVIAAAWYVTADIRYGVNARQYQVVTLANGESYIGKLSGIGHRYAVLDTVYFQQAGADKSDQAANTQDEIVVLRLSSTVAKPEDTLRIRSDDIIHWANLNDDSRIVQAIEQDARAE